MSHRPPEPAALRPRVAPEIALGDLFESVAAHDDQRVSVRGITLDSRLVSAGDLYVALPGRAHHGAEFAAQAVRAGAVAVLTDAAGARTAGALAAPVVVVEDPRPAMATVAARVYGDPAQAMTMFAVTGTNGKTTTTYLLDAALRGAGHRTGLVGTIGFRLDGRPLTATRTTVTTPESPELQALLAYLRQEGAEAVLMEVSSHALALARADAIVFDVAGFTNFGRDHLDFHGDIESYFAAKASLFTAERTRRAVVNIDDPRGVELVSAAGRAGGVEVRTVSLGAEANYRALAYAVGGDGRTAVRARLGARELDFSVAIPGEFNVRNALTALAMIDLARPDIDLDRAAAGLADAVVPGRMQRIDLGVGAPVVYVDFAHTPQAVTAALSAATGRRLIVVLGCGGDRDPDKRGPMGQAAARAADLVIVTDDNPRSEDPARIRAQVVAGAEAARRQGARATSVLDVGDRAAAIGQALELAGPGDVIAILGKGHEDGQDLGGRVVPFSDAEAVARQWRALAETGDRS